MTTHNIMVRKNPKSVLKKEPADSLADALWTLPGFTPFPQEYLHLIRTE